MRAPLPLQARSLQPAWRLTLAPPLRAPPRSWWFKHSVRHLAARLSALGSRLVLRRGADSASALKALVQETGASAVFFNHLYDSISMVRDQQIKDELRGAGVAAHSFNADLLYEPWQVLDDDNQVRRATRLKQSVAAVLLARLTLPG